jgi:2-hydroxyglutarate dehydrogenase
VELLGFNSPGLTSSLAVGEHVARMVRKDVWKERVKDVEDLALGWE